MKILFFGDSITDAGRNRAVDYQYTSYGHGYVYAVTSELLSQDFTKYQIVNRGIGGHRVVDLYARIKADVWNEEPDVLTILVGINDIWHELVAKNGVDLDRFERVYRMMIEDTLQRLPNVKIILLEPFILNGSLTEKYIKECFGTVLDYAKVVERIAKDYNLYFIPLQEKLSERAEKDGAVNYLFDGVHPAMAGAKLIASEWLKLFKEKIERSLQ